MGWIIVLAVFFILIGTLLFAPIRLVIDTPEDRYEISWAYVVYGTVIPIESDIQLRLSVFGFRKSWNVVELAARPSKKKEKKEKEKKKKKKRRKFSPYLIPQILKSFKVKQLKADIDFDSVYWNAWLYPAGQIFRTENIQCSTNFEGRNVLVLEIENRPVWLVQNFIKWKLKQNNNA